MIDVVLVDQCCQPFGCCTIQHLLDNPKVTVITSLVKSVVVEALSTFASHRYERLAGLADVNTTYALINQWHRLSASSTGRTEDG
eukprot:m.38862 g.38862  ORF g.38862 m.38862 type:complete len:85 (+) comp12621_c0_seq10:960-1214(+)